MDKILRPERFDTEPTAPNAEKLYKHWKITFQNYLDVSKTTTDNAETVERKKYFALINNISASVYEIISDTTTFDTAMTALDTTYIKPVSEIYNRHQLISCKQDSDSIDVYLQNLERIAKTCDFKAVSAEDNKNQYVRDAFINGLSSSTIRQRLLESSTLTLNEAFRQARVLELAQKQSATYDNNPITAAIQEETITPPPTVAAVQRSRKTESHNNKKEVKEKELCFFCGYPRHARSNCPARNHECKKCNKHGHWERVCQNTQILGAFQSNPQPSLR